MALRAVAALVFLTAVCWGSDCFSQVRFSQVPRYQPARPTTSPFLNLLRPDSGAVPNFHSLVRPAISQGAAFQRQQQQLRRQRVLIRQLEEVGMQQRAAEIRSTGAAATFRNYLHYYPANRARISAQ